jgi:hypothetical protein
MMDYFDTLLTDWDDRQALERKQNKTNFYNLMKEKGFDFTDIDDASRLPKSLIPVIQNDTDAFAAFNQALSDLNKSRQVPVADAVTYLISDFLEVPIALKCLNELNYYAVKTELLKRYRIQLNKQPKETTLLDFLDADDE